MDKKVTWKNFVQVNTREEIELVFYYPSVTMKNRHVLLIGLLIFGVLSLIISVVLSIAAANDAKNKNASRAFSLSAASTAFGVLALVLVGISMVVMFADYSGLLEQISEGTKAKNALTDFVDKQIKASTCTQPVALKDLVSMKEGVAGLCKLPPQ